MSEQHLVVINTQLLLPGQGRLEYPLWICFSALMCFLYITLILIGLFLAGDAESFISL